MLLASGPVIPGGWGKGEGCPIRRTPVVVIVGPALVAQVLAWPLDGQRIPGALGRWLVGIMPVTFGILPFEDNFRALGGDRGRQQTFKRGDGFRLFLSRRLGDLVRVPKAKENQ